MLGFSSGLVCVASCTPVLLPCLAGAAQPFGRTARALGEFLFGRLVGYLVFAVLVWLGGRMLLPVGFWRVLISALAHLAVGGLMIFFGVIASRPPTSATSACAGRGRWAQRAGASLESSTLVMLGLLTGLNACAPFVAVSLRAIEQPDLPSVLLLFASFFLGTCVWFLPLLATPMANRSRRLVIVAQLLAIVVGAYYAYLGTTILGRVMLNEFPISD